MRHRCGNKKLNKAPDQRLAMLVSIVRSLFINGKVTVTVARAKEARRLAEKLITVSKANDLNARRKVESALREKAIVTRIFKTFPEKYEGRSGGYTRITKIGSRTGDAAPMALLELI
jgi:large subunit ribosomal protein L17